MFGKGLENSIFNVPVMWDTPHCLNLAVKDLKEVKNGATNSVPMLELFIKRSNLFYHLMGHGKSFDQLKKVAEKLNLPLRMPLIYAHQW